MVTVRRFDTATQIQETAAADVARVIADKLSVPDSTAHVVLTGGTNGIGTLRALRTIPIDWSRVHLYFGDERVVSVDHPDSNEGQAREALLDHIDIPAANVHGMGLDESCDLDERADAYAAILPDTFDIHLLGMGGEGHINSIFPHSFAGAEKIRPAVPVTDSPKPPKRRITLTYPAIARAERVWLLVSGPDKAEAAKHVIAGADPADWPAAGARGQVETVLYLAP